MRKYSKKKGEGAVYKKQWLAMKTVKLSRQFKTFFYPMDVNITQQLRKKL